jgi:hypothetical protein
MADTTTTGETAIDAPTDATLFRVVKNNANFKATLAQIRKAFTTAVPADNTVLTWDAATADWSAEVSPALDASLLAAAIAPKDGDFLAANQLVAGVATPKKLTRASNRQGLTSGTSIVNVPSAVTSPRDGDMLRYSTLPTATLTISNITADASEPTVTTTTHSLISGATVLIQGVTGMTTANGTWPVKVLSTTTFKIIGPNTTVGVFGGTAEAVVPAGDWLPNNPRWRLIPDNYYGLSGGSFYTDKSPASTSTLTTLSGLSAVFVAGLPVRFVMSSSPTYRYAIITAYSGTTLTIAGAEFTAADEVAELCVGTPEMVHHERFLLPENYGADQPPPTGSTEATKLAVNTSFTNGSYVESFIWRRSKAYLVSFSAIHDSPAGTAPMVTPTIGASFGTGTPVSTENSGNGPSLSGTANTWVHNSPVAIDVNAYDIVMNDVVELDFTSGSSGAPKSLNVICVFVFE